MPPSSKKPVEPWFQSEIRKGLQQLLTLSLEGQPSAEVISGTAIAWETAIWPTKEWIRERDIPRIREAFKTLLQRSQRWPVPGHFIEAIPRWIAPTLPRLANPASDETRREHMAKIDSILDGPGFSDLVHPDLSTPVLPPESFAGAGGDFAGGGTSGSWDSGSSSSDCGSNSCDSGGSVDSGF